MSTHKRLSLPVVPISFILLLLVGTGIYWFFNEGEGDGTLLTVRPSPLRSGCG